MSWDVLLIRTKTNHESMDEIKSENIIPFSQAEIAHEIGKLAAELGAVCDCQDLSWQNLDSDGWSIEFNIGKMRRQSRLCCISEAASRRRCWPFCRWT